jgi:hypothetical protein
MFATFDPDQERLAIFTLGEGYVDMKLETSESEPYRRVRVPVASRPNEGLLRAISALWPILNARYRSAVLRSRRYRLVRWRRVLAR